MESIQANTSLEFRCPHCQKLYTTNMSEIGEGPSYFECYSCESMFGLEQVENIHNNIHDYNHSNTHGNTSDHIHNQKVYNTFLLPTQQPVEKFLEHENLTEEILSGEIDTLNLSSEEQVCPKCGAICSHVAGAPASECYSCGVIFERYKLAHSENEIVVHPSIVRKWRELVHDFSKLESHEEFIQTCQELGDLSYARKKYLELKTMQGEDADCERYIRKVDALIRAPAPKRDVSLDRGPLIEERKDKVSTIKKILISSPYVASGILVGMGAAVSSYRNLIGLGVSLAVLTHGISGLFRKKLT